MTKQEKNEMISFFKEMDAKMEAKEKKQRILAETNPAFPIKRKLKAEEKVTLAIC